MGEEKSEKPSSSAPADQMAPHLSRSCRVPLMTMVLDRIAADSKIEEYFDKVDLHTE